MIFVEILFVKSTKFKNNIKRNAKKSIVWYNKEKKMG